MTKNYSENKFSKIWESTTIFLVFSVILRSVISCPGILQYGIEFYGPEILIPDYYDPDYFFPKFYSPQLKSIQTIQTYIIS